MSENPHFSDPQDICLLLRAHGEQHWLTSEVLPVLRQIETPGSIPENQLGAALAYLELLWLDARLRASETDAAHTKLQEDHQQHDRVLYEKARRYHTAVQRLRASIGQRIARRTLVYPDTVGPLDHEHANL